jgi:ubiquinone/menaquinone biosynthesis C-methylase UbiE
MHRLSYGSNGSSLLTAPSDRKLSETTAAQTRRVYDVLSGIYPLSTWCFHSRAHALALELSGIEDGMRVLELATGSGEMFRKLVRINRNGHTVGVDLSPRMASKTLQQVRSEYPLATTDCQAVDARSLPFRECSFDAIVCCYLLELLNTEDVYLALEEIGRVLRPGGTFTLVTIDQNAGFFNQLYRVAGSVAPAFWGRQVAHRVTEWIESFDFRILAEREVRQSGYPSRVVSALR